LRVNVEDKASPWHLRFGHLHHGGLKELAKKNMVHGLPDMDYEGKFYEECMLGKQARTLFQKKAKYRAKNTLELIYTNICGQSPLNLLAVKGTSFPLSMISHEKLGFIF
jgi:lipocalin